jgi:hypothetical protein
MGKLEKVREAVNSLAKEKNVNFSSFGEKRISDIGRRLERDEIDITQAVEEVAREFNDRGCRLERADLRRLERALSR